MVKRIIFLATLTLFVLSWACQSAESPAPRPGERKARTPAARPAPAADPAEGLTPFELEHGIGPIKERVTLGELDPKLVQMGKDIFETKCAACHQMDRRFVAPQLGGILDQRSPEYVMNMILNPDEMLQRHPVAKEKLAEYLVPMTFQNVTEEDARALLEYIRSYGTGSDAGAER